MDKDKKSKYRRDTITGTVLTKTDKSLTLMTNNGDKKSFVFSKHSKYLTPDMIAALRPGFAVELSVSVDESRDGGLGFVDHLKVIEGQGLSHSQEAIKDKNGVTGEDLAREIIRLGAEIHSISKKLDGLASSGSVTPEEIAIQASRQATELLTSVINAEGINLTAASKNIKTTADLALFIKEVMLQQHKKITEELFLNLVNLPGSLEFDANPQFQRANGK